MIDVDRDVGHGIEKLPVMADDNQGARIAFEPGFQPDESVQIQVIGRFVEQQQIRGAHQRPGQLQAHTPATGKTIHRLIEFAGSEPQAQNECLSPRLCIMGSYIIEQRVGVAHALAIITGFGCRHFGFSSHQSGVAFNDEARGAFVGLGHVLCHLGHLPLGGDIEIAAVLVQGAIK